MKFTTPIVCDDIRREQGSKRSLMGVYSDKIIFNPSISLKDFPIQMQIGVYTVAQREESDTLIDGFDCNVFLDDATESGGKKNIFLLKGGIEDKNNSTIVFDFVAPCKIALPGTLKMLLRVFNGSEEIDRWEGDLIDIVLFPRTPST